MLANIFILITIIFSSIDCMESPIVKTTSGYVRGMSVNILNTKVNQFLNIPYAEPPIGRLRFRRPVPLNKPLNHIIDGTRFGNSCFQSKTNIIQIVPQSEDCLVLNVWTNSYINGLKPVMFWIHGGNLVYDSIFNYHFNGCALATMDVVVVTVNYRLGPLGWLFGGVDSAPGNVGLYDQLLALNWVKNNIQLFGGDYNEITIFGESAGSWSVSAHIISPLSRGLFKRAILQSGSILQNKITPYLPASEALKQARRFANHFNCFNDKQWLDCLRSVDPKILLSYENIFSYLIYGTNILPNSVQQAFKTKDYNRDIDIMAGVVKDEGSIYPEENNINIKKLNSTQDFQDAVKILPYPNLNAERITEFYLRNISKINNQNLKQAMYSFLGDFFIKCPTYLFTKLFARITPQRNVYFYYWTYVSSQIASQWNCTKEMGVCHQSEIAYVFGEPFLYNNNNKNDFTDKSFSEYTMKLWTNFAKSGNPLEGFPPQFQWPRLVKGGPINGVPKFKKMNPFRPNHIIDDLFAINCDAFWKNYFI